MLDCFSGFFQHEINQCANVFSALSFQKCKYCNVIPANILFQFFHYLEPMKRVFILLMFPLSTFAQNSPCELLIRNGKIIDGTGNNWFYGDIAVSNGKIIGIGRQLNFSADKTIDANGLIVAPGFIDVHTHLEEDEAKDPMAQNFIYDGVTTCITGNCGLSNTDISKYLQMD